MGKTTTTNKALVRNATGGFGLIEMAIVMAIVGLFATISVPRYANSLTRYRADAAAQRVVADLELAQSAARQAAASRQVTCDSANDTYQLQNVKNLNDNAANDDWI